MHRGSREPLCPSTLSLEPSAAARCWLVGCLVVCLLTVRASAAAAFGFSVEPARVEVSIPAGKRRGKTLLIKNHRHDAAIHVTVYSRDVVYLPDGSQDFPEPGSTSWSCASWIQAVPAQLDIPPGSFREVRVSVTAPADATGGHYAVLFFETSPSYAEEGIGVNFRIGAIVEALIPGTEQRNVKLTDLSFHAPAKVQTNLFNDSNLLIRPGGHIKILNSAGKKLQQFEFNPMRLGILPGTSRTFTLEIPETLATGRYQLRAELDYGTRHLLVGERAVDVPP